MENQEIKAWIEGPREYEEGRALFAKYSRKKGLISLFQRKHKPKVLLYNLQKLLTKPTPLTSIPATQDRMTAPETTPIPVKRTEVETHTVHYEQLPEALKTLYNQNRILYKQMRALHEKMKIAPDDDTRAKLRNELTDYDDLIASNWQKIDAWDGINHPEDTEAEKLTDDEKKKQIIAARKFLSVNLDTLKNSEGLKRQLVVFKIEDRIRFLQGNKVIIGKETLETFRKLGVDC